MFLHETVLITIRYPMSVCNKNDLSPTTLDHKQIRIYFYLILKTCLLYIIDADYTCLGVNSISNVSQGS